MKKLIVKAGLLAGAVLAMLGTTTPANADQGITQITEETPLYLNYIPAQASAGDVLGYHYSHASHGSHESHASHVSHYSGY
jgi:hypothetical protein